MTGAPTPLNSVTYEVSGHTATIKINRPDRLNALSFATLAELCSAFESADRDPNVRAIVLSGTGDRAFCVGADLSGERDGLTATERAEHVELPELFHQLWSSGTPTIARVAGYCFAGGFGLALSCDFVIASHDAQFGLPEVNVGLWPMMVTIPILRSMSPRLALDLMLTGRRLSADDAAQLGIINRAVSIDDLDSEVDRVAKTLTQKSSTAIRIGRRTFYDVVDIDVARSLALLRQGLALVSTTEDAREGARAFRERRAPNWAGR